MSSLYHLRDLLISTSMGLKTVLFKSLGPSKIFYSYYFIQQGHIILIKSSSKDVHNITKDFSSNILSCSVYSKLLQVMCSRYPYTFIFSWNTYQFVILYYPYSQSFNMPS